MSLSKEQKQHYINKYSNKQGFLIPLLQDLQSINGYLSKELISFASEAFNIKKAEIYGVATFYSLFRLKPIGKNIIRVCKGTACHVTGADNLISTLRMTLNIPIDQDTTEDMNYTIIEVACLGCCSLAPAIMVNDKIYGNLSAEKVAGLGFRV